MSKEYKTVIQIIRGLDIGKTFGGAELFGVKLAQELNKQEGYKVLVCAFYSVGSEKEKEWSEALNDEGITTFFVSEWGGNSNLTKFIRGISRLLLTLGKLKPDIVQSHFPLGTVAALFLKSCGLVKAAFSTSHLCIEWREGKWAWLLSPLFIDRIFPWLLDGEVGVSQAICDFLKNRRNGKNDKAKIHLIYNGIDLEQLIESSQISPYPEIKDMLPQSSYIIGCAGRLTEQKGYQYILQAMVDVLEQIPYCMLVMVGDGELKTELEKMTTDLGLSGNVLFLGLRDDVPALMRQWDIFVLPSLWEGLPTVILEAMACNLPVIATDIPGTNELVEANVTGLLVPQKDPKALADAILKLLQNPDLKDELIKRAQDKLQRYDMKHIAQNYCLLYQKN